MAKKYIVDLSKDEKAELVSLTQKGRPGTRKIKRANILRLDRRLASQAIVASEVGAWHSR